MAESVVVISSPGARSTVYQVTHDSHVTTYYFCCETCGQCSRHWGDKQKVLAMAWEHTFDLDHTRYHDDDD